MKKLTVVLFLKSGGSYGFIDVLLLKHHLKRLLGKQVRIFCFNDLVKSIELKDGVHWIPVRNKSWNGWWTKMNMFHPKLKSIRPFLYLDLDTAVVRDFTEALPKDENQFLTLEDFYRKGHVGSGLMWIPKDNPKMDLIWEKWIVNPEEHIKRFRGDQDFIESVTQPDKYWQQITDQIGSFKPIRGGEWLRTLPDKLKIVCFHGSPKIPEAEKTINWVWKYKKDFYDKE